MTNPVDMAATPVLTEEGFRAELKALLQKYNMTISWAYDGGTDTHGIYGEGIEFSTPWNYPKETTIRFTIDGQDIDHTDL